MIVSEIPIDNQKSTFFFNKKGNRIKNANDGITNQKIPCDNSATFVTSFVSMYIQIKASNETSGIEAKRLPANVLRFDISVIATMVIEDSNTLIM